MKKSLGFTIIELSIVLVVIALVVSGIMTSRTMIRNSQLQQTAVDYDRYNKAVREFADKYQGLPGDITNAETLWGSDTACPNTVTNTTAKRATCNGDGAGTIGTSTTAAVLSLQYEWFRAWQQLSNAGFIEGRFTGVRGSSSTTDSVVGQNVPQASSSTHGWSMFFYSATSSNTTLVYSPFTGHILLGGRQTSGSYTDSGAFSSIELYAIDQKIDDGLPGKGNLRTQRVANCMESTASSATTYKSGGTDQNCTALFVMGF